MGFRTRTKVRIAMLEQDQLTRKFLVGFGDFDVSCVLLKHTQVVADNHAASPIFCCCMPAVCLATVLFSQFYRTDELTSDLCCRRRRTGFAHKSHKN